MGTLRGDNGGGERPQDGGGLPDLPASWGTIIVPDDPGSLDNEGTALRRQFRREARRRRWRRRFHLSIPPLGRVDEDNPGLALPLLIMSIAVIATLTSLFMVAWPARQRPHQTPSTLTVAPTQSALAELDLTTPGGDPVRLRDLVPAVVILLDGCGCEALVNDTISAVRALPTSATRTTRPVSVLLVSAIVPSALPTDAGVAPQRSAATGDRVYRLADPNRSIRAAVAGLSGTEGPAVVLLAADATVLKTVPGATSTADFVGALPVL